MSRKKREFNLFEAEAKPPKESRISDVGYLDDVVEEIDTPQPKIAMKADRKDYIRHTFIINPNDLEELKSIVHDVKSSGRYKFSQKEALHEAIMLLRKKVDGN